jgi:hypothetical protein
MARSVRLDLRGSHLKGGIAMVKELYCEGIGEIAITGSVVRMDLLSLSLEERDDKAQPKLVLRKRVVMPIDGFLRSFAVLSQAVQELEKRGVVRKVDTSGKGTPASKGPPGSPNFA